MPTNQFFVLKYIIASHKQKFIIYQALKCDIMKIDSGQNSWSGFKMSSEENQSSLSQKQKKTEAFNHCVFIGVFQSVDRGL